MRNRALLACNRRATSGMRLARSRRAKRTIPCATGMCGALLGGSVLVGAPPSPAERRDGATALRSGWVWCVVVMRQDAPIGTGHQRDDVPGAALQRDRERRGRGDQRGERQRQEWS